MQRFPGPSAIALPLVCTALGATLFLISTAQVRQLPLSAGETRLPPAMPPWVTTLMSGGDRFLAADLYMIRIMASEKGITQGEQQTERIARLLETVISQNPRKADTYYFAEAFLPWEGRVKTTQIILKKAAKARSWDWQPWFFRAFNTFYFQSHPGEAAPLLEQAARLAPGKNRQALKDLAARWAAVGQNPQDALRFLKGLVQDAQGPLGQRLKARQQQIQGLIALQEANQAYQRQRGHPPSRIEALVGYGDLEEIPTDPFGEGYKIDDKGAIQIRPPRALREGYEPPGVHAQ